MIGPSSLTTSIRPLAGSHNELTEPSKNSASLAFNRSRKKRASLPNDTGSVVMTNNGLPPGAMPTALRM